MPVYPVTMTRKIQIYIQADNEDDAHGAVEELNEIGDLGEELKQAEDWMIDVQSVPVSRKPTHKVEKNGPRLDLVPVEADTNCVTTGDGGCEGTDCMHDEKKP